MKRAAHARLKIAVLLAASAALFGGCGVRYSDPEPGTEFFESIEFSGDQSVGSTVTVTLEVTQNYPVEVEAVCELRQDQETIREISRDIVPALAGGNPDATPARSTLTHDVVVDEPGKYFIECLTLKDEDNFIAKELIIS